MNATIVQLDTTSTLPPRGASGVRIGDAIAALLVAKRAANLRPPYITRLRCYLCNAFAKGREDWPLEAFTIEVIEKWFEERQEPYSTQSSNLGLISALFSFSMRREWVTKNPCRLMERIRTDRKSPVILSPLQAALLMDYVRRRKPGQLAFYALALYAGVRPQEIERLKWDAINFADGVVTIGAEVSKVRRRRIIYLEPTALRWLTLARQKKATLPAARSTRVRFIRQARRVLGWTRWPADCLRHSAASYLLELHRDAGKVAMLLGNSERILHGHYKALVTAADCKEFWSFTPDSPRPVKPKPVPVPPPPLVPVVMPNVWGVTIDPKWTRFVRAEAAIKVEPTLRALAKQRQRDAAYHGGKTHQPMPGDRIDTIRQMGKLAGVSRQTIQYCRVIIKLADPDILDRLREGKLTIGGTWKRLVGETKIAAAVAQSVQQATEGKETA